MAEEFNRSRLSRRECEILDFASDGLTDQQIALRLKISTSTVNSYWVRVRGKLGQLSRTELVATSLRQQAKLEMRELQAQTAHLEEVTR
ncbi:MAG: helix-turn-helix domain-containing protein [Fimbriimonas sp.]